LVSTDRSGSAADGRAKEWPGRREQGCIATRFNSEASRRIPKDPTRVKLKKMIEGLNDVSAGSFRVHFTENRVAYKLLELSLIDSQGRVRA